MNPYIVGLPADTIASLIEATVTQERASTCMDPCGLNKWVYTVSYDDEQLIDDFLLTEHDIRAIFCGSSCLPCFFDDCKKLRKCCQVCDDTPVILLLKVDEDQSLSEVEFILP